MIELVGEDEIAKRKPYKFSEEVLDRLRKEKKEREMKRRKIAQSIVRVNDITEIVPGDIIQKYTLDNIMKT